MITTVSVPYFTAANSSDFEQDNTFMLWFTGLTDGDSDEITSSEQYMGYPVGYTGPVFN